MKYIVAFILLFQMLFAEEHIPYTIGNMIIDMEAKYDVTVDRNVNISAQHITLNNLMIGLGKKFEQKDYTSREKALGLLHSITLFLKKCGYTFKYKKKGGSLINTLSTKIGDCDSFAYIYLSIAEYYDLPISFSYFVTRNNVAHIFIKFQFSITETVNWDTQHHKCLSDSFYIKASAFDEGSLGVNDYLSVLNKKQAFEFSKLRVSNYLMCDKQFERAVALSGNANNVLPKSPYAYRALGDLNFLQNNYDLAKQKYMKAIDLDKNYTMAKFNLKVTMKNIEQNAARDADKLRP